MRQSNKVVEEATLTGKDVITPSDVSKAISGDREALIEQLARARQVALEQLEARKNAEANGVFPTNMKSKEELEAEVYKREAQLNAAMVSANINQNSQNQQVYQANNTNVEVKHLQAEAEAKSRVKPVLKQAYNSQVNTNAIAVTNTNEATNTKANIVHGSNTALNTTIQTIPQTNQVPINTVNKPINNPRVLASNQPLSANQKEVVKKKSNASSNFKYYMTIGLFVFLFFLISFLPNISNYFSMLKSQKEAKSRAIITTGTLECELSKYDKKYDYTYESIFTFKDSKLLKLSYKVTTKGDKNKDINELTSFNNECSHLKENTSSLDGVLVKCSLNNGVNISEQVLRYDEIDVDKVNTAYLEAGGIYPNFSYNEDIDSVEKNMKASGYTCNRYK